MNNILKCTNLNNKRIMDTGCFNGYFSFQCLKNGAKQVIGVDLGNDTPEHFIYHRIAIRSKNDILYFLTNMFNRFWCTYNIF